MDVRRAGTPLSLTIGSCANTVSISQFWPIDDKSKVKDVIVLRAPTLCEHELLNFYHNQTAAMQDIENTEEAPDQAAGLVRLSYSCIRLLAHMF
jgi:hypothetical protein